MPCCLSLFGLSDGLSFGTPCLWRDAPRISNLAISSSPPEPSPEKLKLIWPPAASTEALVGASLRKSFFIKYSKKLTIITPTKTPSTYLIPLTKVVRKESGSVLWWCGGGGEGGKQQQQVVCGGGGGGQRGICGGGGGGGA
ncbi:hypothetical protein TSUD_42490 [Trifolium subterraneum]|uniref:Uncharacterized protein n=1 Tax=Trifolium subterraneum TaxID=3900 RepID=A0A2Z6LL00_TRISU|nr:hypothetical protein TSUD_42490 [Trifolium subterraneum]